MKNKNVMWIVQGAIIAAIYAVLTIILAPISYGQLQVRISEALTIFTSLHPCRHPRAIYWLYHC